MPLEVFEAVVVDAAPEGAPPGHIVVYCPEIADDEELPVTVAPLFPCWTAGGWHSVPQSVLPETEDASGTDEDLVRVIVLALTEYDLRWIGTSQQWDEITDNPTRCGARSPKGHHKIIMDDDVGVQIVVADDSSKDGVKNYLSIGTDNVVILATADGAVLQLNDNVASITNSSSDTFVMDGENGIVLAHGGGGELLSLESGVAKLMGADTQIIGGAVTITGLGGIVLTDDLTGLATTEPPILGTSFLTDLLTFLNACVADVANAPGVAAGAGVLAGTVTASLGAGAPYLSTVVEIA